MPDTTDPVAATLAGIRERQALASDASLGFARMDERHEALLKSCYEDNPRLLAAAEAVLKEADDFEANRPERLVTRRYASECFRAVIIREMTGEEPGDGTS